MMANSIKSKVDSWLEKTINQSLNWEATSSITMFKIHDGDNVYSIEKKENEDYEIAEWNENGDIVDTYASNEASMKQLYETVINSKSEFVNRLEEVNEKGDTDCVSLLQIMKLLGIEKEGSNEYINIKENNSFYYVRDANPYYVEPPFSKLQTYKETVPFNETDVILVSAAGATGKSALSAYLSKEINIPLFDLGKHTAVASNSLSGLFMNCLEQDECYRFANGLKQDKFSMIIDGLDEGEIRSGSTKAFEDFLLDIVNTAKNAKGTPFIMLGRHRTVMDTAFFLELHDVRVVCLQIEPFMQTEALEFIDKAIEKKDSTIRFEQPYRAVREYIINSIEGFFKDDVGIKKQSFNRFIGYAPVLMAIASLLDERQDFNKLLLELQSERKKNINLVISIIEKILIREQGKVREKALHGIFEKYDEVFIKEISKRAYDIDEQCARIMNQIMHKRYNRQISEREEFNHSYNERMNEWTPNHPFIDMKEPQNPRFQNIVFESYVVARLAGKEKYSHMLVEYLNNTNSNSYLLFDFYDQIVDDSRFMNHLLISYMYDSFRALDSNSYMYDPFRALDSNSYSFRTTDSNNSTSAMDIISIPQKSEDTSIYCELSFYREGQDVEYNFKTIIPKDKALVLPSSLYGITIDIPSSVVCNTTRLDITPPVSIRCEKMTIISNDVVITPNDWEIAVINCNEFVAQKRDGNIPNVINRDNNMDVLSINSNNDLMHPFSKFSREKNYKVKEETSLQEKFDEICRILLLFRSNHRVIIAEKDGGNTVQKTPPVIDKLIARGGVIKDGDRLFVMNIDSSNKQLAALGSNIRFFPTRNSIKIKCGVGRTKNGMKVLERLINDKVLYEFEGLYVLNTDYLKSVLGINYDDVISYDISLNGKARQFLKGIS